VYLLIAEAGFRHGSIAALAAPRFDAPVHWIPREYGVGALVPAHQLRSDALNRQSAREHADGLQMDPYAVAVRGVDQPGPVAPRSRFEAFDLAAPCIGAWYDPLQLSSDGLIELDMILT
jgi:hypothetical protein